MWIVCQSSKSTGPHVGGLTFIIFGMDISEMGCMLLIQDYVMVFLFSAAC